MARAGIVQARWSDEILDECFDAILRERPDLRPEALERTRQLKQEAIPDCMVSSYQDIVREARDDEHATASGSGSGKS